MINWQTHPSSGVLCLVSIFDRNDGHNLFISYDMDIGSPVVDVDHHYIFVSWASRCIWNKKYPSCHVNAILSSTEAQWALYIVNKNGQKIEIEIFQNNNDIMLTIICNYLAAAADQSKHEKQETDHADQLDWSR